jgi:hypothetical protein
MTKITLSSLRQDLRAHVVADPRGDLPLWGRLKLWRAMRAEFGKESSLRRSCLALYVCQGLLPRWEQAQMPRPYREFPQTVCELARQHLREMISKRALDVLVTEYAQLDQYAMCVCDWEQKGDAVSLFQGSRWVLDRAVDEDDETYRRKELYADCDSDDASDWPTEELWGESYLWDIHFVGSILAANGVPGLDHSDNAARRRYWLHWLDEVLPLFLEEIQQARSLAQLGELKERGW